MFEKYSPFEHALCILYGVYLAGDEDVVMVCLKRLSNMFHPFYEDRAKTDLKRLIEVTEVIVKSALYRESRKEGKKEKKKEKRRRRRKR